MRGHRRSDVDAVRLARVSRPSRLPGRSRRRSRPSRRVRSARRADTVRAWAGRRDVDVVEERVADASTAARSPCRRGQRAHRPGRARPHSRAASRGRSRARASTSRCCAIRSPSLLHWGRFDAAVVRTPPEVSVAASDRRTRGARARSSGPASTSSPASIPTRARRRRRARSGTGRRHRLGRRGSGEAVARARPPSRRRRSAASARPGDATADRDARRASC